MLLRMQWKMRIVEIECIRKLDLKHKAKFKWHIDGEENGKFFNEMINCNKKNNRINGLLIDGVWTTCLSKIKEEVRRFFANKFDDHFPIRLKLVNNNFRNWRVATYILDKAFTLEDVKDFVWGCENDKAPWMDGFTFKFIK